MATGNFGITNPEYIFYNNKFGLLRSYFSSEPLAGTDWYNCRKTSKICTWYKVNDMLEVVSVKTMRYGWQQEDGLRVIPLQWSNGTKMSPNH